MINWRHVIDERVRFFHSLLFAVGEMRDTLPAFWNESFDLRGRTSVRGKPSGIHSKHKCQITTCGMAAYKNFTRIAAIVLDIFQNPGQASGGILKAIDNLATILLGETVTHAADDDWLFFVAFKEWCRNAFRAASETAAVIPDDDGTVFCVFWSIDVENAPLFHIVVCVLLFGTVADVFRDNSVGGDLCKNRASQTKEKENGDMLHDSSFSDCGSLQMAVCH